MLQFGHGRVSRGRAALTAVVLALSVSAFAQDVSLSQNVPATYVPGETVTIQLTLSSTAGPGAVTALGFYLGLPSGWSLALEAPDIVLGELCIPLVTTLPAAPAANPQLPFPPYLDAPDNTQCNPFVGSPDPLAFYFGPGGGIEGEGDAEPVFSITVTIVVDVPAEATGDQTISTTVVYRLDDEEVSLPAETDIISMAAAEGEGASEGEGEGANEGEGGAECASYPDCVSHHFYEVGDELCLAPPCPVASGSTFVWARDSEPLDDDDRVHGTAARVLSFDYLIPGDSGIYTCIYDDGAKIETQFEVTVMVVEDLPAPGAPVALVGMVLAGLAAAARRCWR